MKQFYLKQKVFALRDRYKVYDEEQTLAYYVEGKMFSFTRLMNFYREKDKQHLYIIKKNFISFLPKYRLLNPDETQVAMLTKRISFMKHKFDITSDLGDLKMEGNMWGHDFKVMDGDNILLEVHKKWLSWGDTYQITIHDDSKTELLLALVLMIDDCLHDSQNQSH
jgi:uncharacterized protein YxjI